MAQSLSRNLIHVIYSTKNREPHLTEDIRPRLYAYQAGILQECECLAILIGGHVDHVHMLFVLSKNAPLCGVIEDVKKKSSRWMKTQGERFRTFHWQSGYGAFSVSQSHVSRVRRYIEDQEKHHCTISFQDEFRLFLSKYGIGYDEHYVWD